MLCPWKDQSANDAGLKSVSCKCYSKNKFVKVEFMTPCQEFSNGRVPGQLKAVCKINQIKESVAVYICILSQPFHLKTITNAKFYTNTAYVFKYMHTMSRTYRSIPTNTGLMFS